MAILTNIALVDVLTGEVAVGQAIETRGHRIHKLGPAERLEIPNEVDPVDGGGRYVIPGLIDMHVHYRDWVPELFVNHGVTTVRDMGNQLAWIMSQKHAAECGWLDIRRAGWTSRSGPRIISFAATTSDPAKGHHTVIEPGSEVLPQVQALLDAGVDGIKFHQGSITQVAVEVIRIAHDAGLRVSAHPSPAFDVLTGVRSGLDSVEHSKDIPHLEEDLGRQVVHEMLEREVYWCPTLTIDESGLLNPPPGWGDVIGVSPEDARDARALIADPRLAYLPDRWREVIRIIYQEGGRPPVNDVARHENFEHFRSLIREYADGGGRILTGSDACFISVPGLVLHEEMSAMVEALGFAPLEALRSATLYPSQFLDRPDLGRIAVGSTADLVLLERNPLEDIRATRSVSAVMQGGEWIELGYSEDFVQLLPRPAIPQSPEIAEYLFDPDFVPQHNP